MNRDCDPTRLALGAYALGTLEPDDDLAVEAHLATCPDCRAELDEIASVVPALALLAPDDVAPVVPSDDLFARIAAEVAVPAPVPVPVPAPAAASVTTPSTAFPLRRRVAVGLVAAALVVVAGVGVGLVRSHDHHVPVTTASATQDGVRMAVAATSHGSGTRLALTVDGLPAHEWCHLVATAADGSTHDAGSWKASYDGEAQVVEATDVARTDLRSLALYGDHGRRLVVVRL